jgi:hypothetical protein
MPAMPGQHLLQGLFQPGQRQVLGAKGLDSVARRL